GVCQREGLRGADGGLADVFRDAVEIQQRVAVVLGARARAFGLSAAPSSRAPAFASGRTGDQPCQEDRAANTRSRPRSLRAMHEPMVLCRLVDANDGGQVSREEGFLRRPNRGVGASARARRSTERAVARADAASIVGSFALARAVMGRLLRRGVTEGMRAAQRGVAPRRPDIPPSERTPTARRAETREMSSSARAT